MAMAEPWPVSARQCNDRGNWAIARGVDKRNTGMTGAKPSHAHFLYVPDMQKQYAGEISLRHLYTFAAPNQP